MKVSRFSRTTMVDGRQKDETEIEEMVVDNGEWTRFV